MQADDNPEGVPVKVFEDIKAAIRQDRFAYQKAYAAGARLLTVVDQLYQSLLQIQ